jgi:hypothetical protein
MSPPPDSERSLEELLDEYSSIVTLTQRAEYSLRVREITDEILKRIAPQLPTKRRRGYRRARRPVAESLRAGTPEF